MALDPSLIKLVVVEAAKFRRHAAQRSDQAELWSDEVCDESKPRLLRERETTVGFAFHLSKRIARREKVRVQLVATVRRVDEITDLVGPSKARRSRRG